MKQKRTYVTLLLVVALLALGIAYAALSTQDMVVTMSVDGSTTDTPYAVKITAIEQVAGTKGTVTGTVGNGTTNSTIAVSGLAAANDEAKAEITFTGTQADVAAVLSQVAVTGEYNNKWLAVSSEITDSAVEATNGTAKAVVTFKLLQTVGTEADETKASADGLVITYTATPSDK